MLGHQPAEDITEEHSAKPACQRYQFGRQPDRAGLHKIDDMRGAIGTKAEQNGMPEREQAGLSHQHVVGQREDRHHADLAHQRQHEAGMAALAPVVEQERERQQDDEDQQPGPMAA